MEWQFVQAFLYSKWCQAGRSFEPCFCVFFDELFCKLSGAGYGCHIGDADDVVLLAPSPYAMHNMLALCDEVDNEYSVVFNANKSKCLHQLLSRQPK